MKIQRVLSGVTAAVLLCGCSAGKEPQSGTKFLMDTYMTVTLYDGDSGDISAAFERAEELEGKWSVTDPGSEIYAADHNSGQAVTLSEDTADLVRFAVDMNERTGGALDISLYPVLCEWGFTTGEFRVPSAEKISGLLEDTGCGRIELSGDDITLPEGMSIDLGAVGKGWTGDEMARVLKERGVTSGMLDLGGNIQLIGSKPDGSDFVIAVRDPVGDGNIAKVSVNDCAVVTSGGYERYFEEGGEVYWHILDPKTGYPAHSGIISATIVGESGTLCDALSTAVFVMGKDRAADMWREYGDFDMVLVEDNGGIVITEGIEDRFTLYDDYSDRTVEVVHREK